ncbi:MAG: glycosyltransferase [Chloroflexi bacterium]|nr:glycosyltransferase [Chloroflexota bacterium]
MTHLKKSRRVLLICNDVIGQNMTGPAIRYWEFARVLSQYFTVTLAIPPFVQAASAPEMLNPNFEVKLCQTQAELQALTHTTDVIISVGANLSLYPFLAQTSKPLVMDMYIPFMLEDLQKYADRSVNERNILHQASRSAHTLQIRAADFILCASEKQKDFWLGWLSALGRVNPYTHADDPTLANLIEVVPFGLPCEAPVHQKQVLKGAYKTIAPTDKVILWGGGLWYWLDPFTLIKAVALIARAHPDIKLLFLGANSPNVALTKTESAAKVIKFSQELGLYDRQVFFYDWAPYQERQNYLLEADIGASLHLNHIETRFAFRTRFLDYIWAGLPILTSAGDIMSDEVTRWGLGKVVKNGDAEQVGQALVELLTTPNLRQEYHPRFEQVRQKYEWGTVMTPLIKFCEAPYLAATYLKFSQTCNLC